MKIYINVKENCHCGKMSHKELARLEEELSLHVHGACVGVILSFLGKLCCISHLKAGRVSDFILKP